jgi:glyoxylase-like metal-dependent hydrolase (beta-lactamase superfamily II)
MIRTLDLVFQNNACAIASYLLEGKTGLILIETGPHSTLPQLKKAIEEQGFKIEDVKNVLLTHIHLDHAGAAWTFAKQGATIYLHPFGVRHMADPSKLMESAKRIYQDKMDELWGEMHPIPEAQMITAAHEEKVEVDGLTFTAYHTPGHASHHIAWEIDKVVFTGDVAGVQIGNGPVIAPLPPPDIDIEQWKESIQLLRDIKPKAMYLTHYGAVIDVEHHLDQLEDNIENLSKWVKTHLEAGESIEEMTPLFDEYCVEQLKELEMTSVEIEQYQAANPAWMSVAGLTRYWQKKNK